MHPPIELFEYERTDDMLVVRPATNLGEFESEQLEAEITRLLKLLEDSSLHKVVVDFHRCAYFGSSAVRALTRIARTARDGGREMVLTNLSKCEREMIDALHLGDVWTIKGSVKTN